MYYKKSDILFDLKANKVKFNALMGDKAYKLKVYFEDAYGRKTNSAGQNKNKFKKTKISSAKF